MEPLTMALDLSSVVRMELHYSTDWARVSNREFISRAKSRLKIYLASVRFCWRKGLRKIWNGGYGFYSVFCFYSPNW